jgi:hypothetical protein
VDSGLYGREHGEVDVNSGGQRGLEGVRGSGFRGSDGWIQGVRGGQKGSEGVDSHLYAVRGSESGRANCPSMPGHVDPPSWSISKR